MFAIVCWLDCGNPRETGTFKRAKDKCLVPFFLPRPLLSVTGGHFELHVGFSLTEMNFPPIKMVVSNRNLRISRGKTPHFQGRMTFFWSIQLGLPWDLKSYEKNPNDLELVMQKHQKTYAKEHLKTMILYEVLRCEQLLNKKSRWCELMRMNINEINATSSNQRLWSSSNGNSLRNGKPKPWFHALFDP